MKAIFMMLVSMMMVNSALAASSAFAEKCAQSRFGTLHGDDLLALINKEPEQQLRADYQPSDLVPVPKKYISRKASGKQSLRSEAMDAYIRMVDAAANEGVKLFIHSSYRSFDEQCATFAAKVIKWTNKFSDKEKGIDYARKSSAEPGRSQHQLGTTVDIVFEPALNFSFKMAQTKEMAWLEENAYKYGWVMSYPYADDDGDALGYNEQTGYYYEPWHWRYIGPKEATVMKWARQPTILDDLLKQWR